MKIRKHEGIVPARVNKAFALIYGGEHRAAWHRPQYQLAAFYPATPDSWLVKGITKIMSEEGERIGLTIKVVEESSTSLGPLLTKTDLLGCFYPDCSSLMWGQVI